MLNLFFERFESRKSEFYKINDFLTKSSFLPQNLQNFKIDDLSEFSS